VGLGANLGDAPATLRAAVQAMAGWPHSRLIGCSGLYRSAPVHAQGPDFYNAVVALDSQLDADALLAALQALEQAHGRERPYTNAPRTLDLDLLLLGDTACHTPRLTLPHPRLHQRAFVLLPLLELSPEQVAPALGRLADHLPAVRGQAIVKVGPLQP
jgi:2-amino-4-hydroxy-6-hydroxymethyldihydropteridine diphosphokinase